MSEIIETIDGALYDWSIGPDAMRWSPDPVAPPPLPPPNLTAVSGALRVVPIVTQFEDALRAVADACARLDLSALQAFAAALQPGPSNGPRPLCIDGHEYRRRRRGR